MRMLVTSALLSVVCAAPAPPSLQSVELTIPAAGATLAATLQFPAAGRAPFPAIVLVHGSGRMTRDQMRWMGDRLLGMGLAVLTYDKRGVGQSTGTYVNVGTAGSVEVFGQLADDALAGVSVLRNRKDIDAKRVGLGGNSQAGWITPLAAARSRDVAFVVITSGPAVTVGEEIEYSRLAGADPGSIQGLSDDEIDRRMRLFKGPHGFDPVLVLEQLQTPSIWIEGQADRSVPMARTLATLERIRASGRPITVVALSGADHSLRNPATGERPDYWPRVHAWLQAIAILPK